MRYLIYGATGYTGELIAKAAKARGHDVVLAGRSDSVLALGRALDLPAKRVAVDDAPGFRAAIVGMSSVLNCAGPFSRTAAAVVDACLAARVHYFDITGEISVFEALAARHADAARAGIVVCPGVGFDVVPSDCLAAHVKARLPDATSLQLGFLALSGISHGTAKTMVEHTNAGSYARVNGKLVSVPLYHTRTFDFGRGPRTCIRIPWGNLATAFRSTGIGNIETYMAAPPALRNFMRVQGVLKPLLGLAPLRKTLQRLIDFLPAGPTEEQRHSSEAILIAEARTVDGRVARARLRTPEAYHLTVLTALLAVERAQQLALPAGYATPSQLFGTDFILDIPGTVRTDLD